MEAKRVSAGGIVVDSYGSVLCMGLATTTRTIPIPFLCLENKYVYQIEVHENRIIC